jgi:CheY-like chemotaxis protein
LLHPFGDSCKSVERGAQSSFALDSPPSNAGKRIIPRVKDTDKVVQMAEVISRQAQHLTGLVDDLLDVSRVSRGQVQLTQETLLLHSILSDVLEQVEPAAAAREQLIARILPAQKVYVQGDRKRLVQVFVNVLVNASKYTPQRGRISLTVTTTDQRAVIQIDDNGIGMSPQLCASAFELFVQGERAVNRSQGGLGLGLALVKSLVSLHGGTVSEVSPGPGAGSSFCIELPRVESEKTLEPARALHLMAGKGTILVVDDNEDAAGLLTLMLQDAGFHVWTRHSPSSSLELVQQVTPDVCLLDIGLPEYDGYALVSKLRSIPGLQGSQFAALTGYAQPSDIARSRAAGFHRHFAKPVDPAALIDWLSSLEMTQRV